MRFAFSAALSPLSSRRPLKFCRAPGDERVMSLTRVLSDALVTGLLASALLTIPLVTSWILVRRVGHPGV
jgi:hypothetical protein